MHTARGAGTRVVRPATVPAGVSDAARALALAAREAGLSEDQAVAALREAWPV